jgi:hypothetical protein
VNPRRGPAAGKRNNPGRFTVPRKDQGRYSRAADQAPTARRSLGI